MNPPSELLAALSDALGATARSGRAVTGGDINLALRIKVGNDDVFVKWSLDENAGLRFRTEAEGLAALAAADTPLVVPEVLAVGAEPAFLALTWLEPGVKDKSFFEQVGTGLAALHRETAERYGFEDDNFIGRVPQPNGWHDSWPTFFGEQRLRPQVEEARRRGHWSTAWDVRFRRLLNRLPEMLPERPTISLVHGDLWSGNVMATHDGRVALVDPAVYYGHREVDLAMTQLFGGFGGAYYDAYRAAWRLDPGYTDRRDLYNLYHLLSHLNHFGHKYAGRVERALRRLG